MIYALIIAGLFSANAAVTIGLMLLGGVRDPVELGRGALVACRTVGLVAVVLCLGGGALFLLRAVVRAVLF